MTSRWLAGCGCAAVGAAPPKYFEEAVEQPSNWAGMESAWPLPSQTAAPALPSVHWLPAWPLTKLCGVVDLHRLRGDYILENCRRWVTWCREKNQGGARRGLGRVQECGRTCCAMHPTMPMQAVPAAVAACRNCAEQPLPQTHHRLAPMRKPSSPCVMATLRS